MGQSGYSMYFNIYNVYTNWMMKDSPGNLEEIKKMWLIWEQKKG